MTRLPAVGPLLRGLEPKGIGARQASTTTTGLLCLPLPETQLPSHSPDCSLAQEVPCVSLGAWGRKSKAMARKASCLGNSWAGHHMRDSQGAALPSAHPRGPSPV